MTDPPVPPPAPPPAPTADLRQLVYTSSAHVRHLPGDLEDILAVSRARNRAAGVTGLLLCYESHFIQCLEGPAAAVAATMARIRRDARHRHVSAFLDYPVEQRSFGQWDMACAEPSASRWLELETADWAAHRRLAASSADLPEGVALLLNVWEDATSVRW